MVPAVQQKAKHIACINSLFHRRPEQSKYISHIGSLAAHSLLDSLHEVLVNVSDYSVADLELLLDYCLSIKTICLSKFIQQSQKSFRVLVLEQFSRGSGGPP